MIINIERSDIVNIRIKRLESTYMEEVSMILMDEVKDELLKNAIVTGVSVTNDLSFAKIYFTCLDKSKKNELLKELNNASGFIRTCLADRVDIRHTPELKFVYDESEEYGERIDKIISNLDKH